MTNKCKKYMTVNLKFCDILGQISVFSAMDYGVTG